MALMENDTDKEARKEDVVLEVQDAFMVAPFQLFATRPVKEGGNDEQTEDS